MLFPLYVTILPKHRNNLFEKSEMQVNHSDYKNGYHGYMSDKIFYQFVRFLLLLQFSLFSSYKKNKFLKENLLIFLSFIPFRSTPNTKGRHYIFYPFLQGNQKIPETFVTSIQPGQSACTSVQPDQGLYCRLINFISPQPIMDSSKNGEVHFQKFNEVMVK